MSVGKVDALIGGALFLGALFLLTHVKEQPKSVNDGKVTSVVEYAKGKCQITINSDTLAQDSIWVDVEKTKNANFCDLKVGDHVIIKSMK